MAIHPNRTTILSDVWFDVDVRMDTKEICFKGIRLIVQNIVPSSIVTIILFYFLRGYNNMIV